jgi:predicted ATPase/class 3 adenylate cyclase
VHVLAGTLVHEELRADVTLPTGTITFLRTDIEGSMGLVRALGPRYDALDAEHRAIVRDAVDAHGGQVVRTEGDAFFVVYADAVAAARTAVDIQRAIGDHPWPAEHPIRVRVGLHAGTAHRAGDDYGGFEVSRAARVAAAGWGGQIVISDPVRALIGDALEDGWSVVDLGRHRLAGVPDPQRLYQLCAPGLASDFPPLRGAGAASESLPARLTSIVGREDELESLARLLEGTRLLTLTGPGGTGKTTLALELARRSAADHPDGAWLVDLQAVTEPDLVRGEIAHGLGLFDGPAGPGADRLVAYLSGREALIVIDNFEQVVAAAGVVGEIVRASAGSRVIVTSRVPLRVSGEQEYPVRPLPLDAAIGDAQPEAVRLFLDRARAVRPDLDPSPADLAAIGEICRRLDGLPLAIELAAARMRSLPVSLIRDRLAAHLPLPGGPTGDLPARQRTIEDTVAWSHGLLDAAHQRLFATVSAFEDSFDLEQAQAVAAGEVAGATLDVLDGLMALSDQSLLQPVEDPAGGVRYRMLETIRAFGRARLEAGGATEVIRDRHATAYADLAERSGDGFQSAAQAWWLDRLEADDANLLAATHHAIARPLVRDALRLVGGLWRYWLQSGRLAAGRTLTHAAVDLEGSDEWPSERLKALDALGGVEYWSGDVPAADRIYEQELALAVRTGDGPMEAQAMLNLFYTRDYRLDADGSREAHARAAALFEELGDERGLLRLRMAVPIVSFAAGGPLSDREAGSHHSSLAIPADELDAIAGELGASSDAWASRSEPLLRTLAAWQRGDLPTAARWFARGMREGLELREYTDTALALQMAVVVSIPMDEPLGGATIRGALDTAFERFGIRPPATYEDLGGTDPIPVIIGMLGQDVFDEAEARGRRMTLDQTVEVFEGMVERYLGRVDAGA